MFPIVISVFIFILFSVASLFNEKVENVFLIGISFLLLGCYRGYIKELRKLSFTIIYSSFFVIAGLTIFVFFNSNFIGYFSSFVLILLFSDILFSRNLLSAKTMPDNLVSKVKIIYLILVSGISLTGIVGFFSGLNDWILIFTTICMDIFLIIMITDNKKIA